MMENNNLVCVWVDRVVIVDGSNGMVSIKRLNQTEEVYKMQLCCDQQPLPIEFNKCITCKTVLDSSSGWRVPHLLVSRYSAHSVQQQNGVVHELLVCDSRGSFEPCGMEFKTESPIPNSNYCLVDGPTVMWTKGRCVHIAYGPYLEQVSVDLKVVAPRIKIKEIKGMWCVKEGGSSSLLLLMLQLVIEGTTTMEECEWMSLQVNLPGEELSLDFIPFSGTSEVLATGPKIVRVPDAIPHDYSSIATCITCQKYIHLNTLSGAMLEKRVYLVGTEYQQVVLIEGGITRHVISLGFIPHLITAIKNCTGNIALTVMAKNGDVGGYEIGPDGPKERGVWRNVYACLTGDFAQLGRNQILMLTSGVVSWSFYLTDLSEFTTTDHPPPDENGNKMKDVDKDCPESLLNVLKAFQLKKRTGEVQLTQQETTLQCKYELLSNSLKFMESLGTDNKSTHLIKTDPSLVCLIPGKMEDPVSHDGDHGKDEHQTITVTTEWQRISDGEWLIGLLVKNTSKTVLSSVTASLMVSGQPLTESSCRVVWNESQTLKSEVPSSFSAERNNVPPEKRRRIDLLATAIESPKGRLEDNYLGPLQPGHSICLVVVSPQRTLGLEGTIVGFWMEDGREKVETGELTRVKISTKLVCNGSLSINNCCLNLWNGSLTISGDGEFTKKEVQDMACLLALCSLTQVHVSPQYTHISRLPSMIKARLPLPKHALQVGGESYCSHTPQPPIQDNEASELLKGTAIHIQLQTNTAVFSILHRSKSNLNLVLKLLKECLPDDLDFCLLSEAQTTDHHALLSSMNALREEVSDRAMKLEAALQLHVRNRVKESDQNTHSKYN